MVRSVTGYLFGGGDSPSAKEVNDTAVAQSTWEISTSVSEGRETFVEELRHEYGVGESVDTLQTSHGAAMWSAVETAIARSRVDGDTESAAETDARETLNKYAATSIWNNVDRWNSFWSAMSTAVAKSISGAGVVTPAGGSFTALEDSSQTSIDPQATEPLVTVDDKTYVWADRLDGANVDLPSWLDLTAVSESDDNVEASDLYVTRYVVDGNVVDLLDATTSAVVNAVDPDYGTQTLADAGLYATLVDTTRQLRNNLSASLADTVASIYQKFDVGEMNPADIISAQGMLKEFDSGDGLTEQSAVAGLVARGYAMPSDMQEPVTINHPDLAAETTGWLFVDSSSDLTLTSGQTVPSSEYEMAYIVYESSVDGTTQTQMLSGSSDLQVVEYANTTRTSVSFQTGDTVVKPHYLWITEDPKALSSGSAGRIHVTGNSVDYTFSPDALTDPGAGAPDDAVYEYQHQGVDSNGPDTVEVVEGVTIKPRTTSYTSDPTAPEATRTRVERMEEAWKEIREYLEGLEGGGGGGGGDGGGLGLGGMAALVGGGGILAYVLNGGGGR